MKRNKMIHIRCDDDFYNKLVEISGYYCLTLTDTIRFFVGPQINKELKRIRNERKELNES